MLEIIKEYTKEGNIISHLGNISSICMEEISDLNWVGFYIFNEDFKALVLGPFSGKKATSVIEVGKGVCGTAYENDETMVVDDVHNFCGHIACDIASSSELVIPIHKNGQVIGVMDIDSPLQSRFDEEIVDVFNEVVNYIEENIL